MASTENDPVKTDDPKKAQNGVNGVAKKEERQELTEEDKKLQDDLLMLLERLESSDTSLYSPSLEMLRTLIRTSTTSMTSVPKPLKFMRPQYSRMKAIYEKLPAGPSKNLCADIISVLAMCSDEKSDCLDYRLKGTVGPIDDWGYEYIRHLTMEIASEWKSGNDSRREEMLGIVQDIVKYDLQHNAEVEACDLLLEIERLDILLELIDKEGHERVCLYLLRSSPLAPDPDNQNMIRCAMNIYSKFGHEFEALCCAVMLNDPELIRKLFTSEDS